MVIAAGMLTISINPNVLNRATNVLAGTYSNTGRLVSFIIIVNVGLFFLLMRLSSYLKSQADKHDRLVEELSLEDLNTGDIKGNLLVVIPAYNEEENITQVLKKIPKKIAGYHVSTIVIDDCSQDDTKKVAEECGVPVIRSKVNRGTGGALKLGYIAAQRHKASIVVTLDADGQHDPKEIEKVIKPIVKGKADFVNGSRKLGKQIGGNVLRKIGIPIVNLIITIVLRKRFTDCTSGFRAVRIDLLSKFNLQEKFSNVEALVQAKRHGGRIVEVPITVYPRHSGTSKKPSEFFYGFKWLGALLRAWWK